MKKWNFLKKYGLSYLFISLSLLLMLIATVKKCIKMQLIKGQRQQVGHPASYVTTCIGLLTLLARVRTLACKWLSRRPLGHPSSLSSRRPCPWEEEEEAHPTAHRPSPRANCLSSLLQLLLPPIATSRPLCRGPGQVCCSSLLV